MRQGSFACDMKILQLLFKTAVRRIKEKIWYHVITTLSQIEGKWHIYKRAPRGDGDLLHENLMIKKKALRLPFMHALRSGVSVAIDFFKRFYSVYSRLSKRIFNKTDQAVFVSMNLRIAWLAILVNTTGYPFVWEPLLKETIPTSSPLLFTSGLPEPACGQHYTVITYCLRIIAGVGIRTDKNRNEIFNHTKKETERLKTNDGSKWMTSMAFSVY